MRSLKSYLVLAVLLTTVPVIAADTSGDRFYFVFRDAVLKSDISSVVAITKFPFEVRGTDDSQGVRRYGESGFRRLFGKLLAQKEHVPRNGHVVECTMYEIIKEKGKLTKRDYLTNDFIRVGDFEFQLSQGKWRFTGAYLE